METSLFDTSHFNRARYLAAFKLGSIIKSLFSFLHNSIKTMSQPQFSENDQRELAQVR